MMKINSKSISMKSVCFAVCLIALVISSQFSKADCRALRSAAENSTATATVGGGGCEGEGVDGVQDAAGMASFAVSSNNSTKNGNTNSNNTRPLARSLAFRLASGPSKKGPGH